MFYKFDTNGIYCGTTSTQEQYSTSIAPPDENETATWVWNHVNWVGLPMNWKPIQPVYVEPLAAPVVEETPPTE
jgi:hypothetical protein